MTKYDWVAIKTRVNIADVVGKVVKLNRKNQGLCPFHSEKSPSFQVYDDAAHCYGCGWHGDVVDFVAAMDNCSLAEAITKLGAGDFELTGREKEVLAEREKQRADERRKAVAEARKRWDAASPADAKHPYLQRKQVGPGMARRESGNLLIPVYDASGEIQSVQTIAPDGSKLFQKNAPMKGGRLNFGIFLGRSIVCEGFATAASIYDALPDRIVVAFSKSGVIDMVHELHGRGQSVAIASDRNALEAMLELGAELNVPVYAPPSPHDDFNDLAVDGGDVRAVFDGLPEPVSTTGAGLHYTPVSTTPMSPLQGPVSTTGGLPFPTDSVDLTMPPGKAGELTEWIESQNRRPRRILSAANAIMAIGNIMGLRYRDVRDGVTPNLFAVCIAGSRTGKEGLNQSIVTIHRKAGVSAATLGAIKSEQEIVRNLIDHQPAFYVIDEIGFVLKKIRNAQKGNGSASYLEAVIGVLMSAYSKASGYMPIGGDLMRALRTEFKAELNRLEKDDEGEEWRDDRIKYLNDIISSPEPGLKNPYLSVIGYTTAETFNDVVDFDMATNGFIGRALLFNERDTAPRSKVTKGFVKPDMPMHVEMAIVSIAGGERSFGGRIEYTGEPIDIVTDDEADQMLEDSLVWFEDQAIAHKSSSGLEALYLGAYELVAKVSIILAVFDRVRTAEHVRWAFELIRRDVGEKARLVVSNEREKDDPLLALKARIANWCSGEDGETYGVIINKARGKKKEDIDLVIAEMIEAGAMLKTEKAHKANKKTVVRYRYVGDG